MNTVIVDTNILFSALLGRSHAIRERILTEHELVLYSCKFAFVELFKYKEKIQQKSLLGEEQVLELLHALLKKIRIFNEESITDESLQKAYDLCHNIDEKDIPFVALTIELSGMLWSNDKELKNGLRLKGFDSFFEL